MKWFSISSILANVTSTFDFERDAAPILLPPWRT